jgi:transcriptional regulator with GAF, ATPase, and Fis domain
VAEPRPSGADLQRQLEELRNLHDVARALLGARSAERMASRLVLAAMGSLGARSGALLVPDDRARLRVAFAYGRDDVVAGESLRVGDPAREWMLREGAFVVRSAAAARLLGPSREALLERFDAAAAAAIGDSRGLAALLVLGPHLMGEAAYDNEDLRTLDAIAALGALALGNREAPAGARRGSAPERRAARSLASLRREHPALAALVGESPALLEACDDLVAVAATRFPVLLMGESGVGKELAARAVHELSERAGGPMEVMDCGSIPRELIESELFGHVKGSFTGAHRDRRGAFELAHRGTLFLDEIGEMPLQLQTRLLRVLQEGRFRRVGDEQAIESDVRVVAATNRDLRADVAAGRFREDLFYRLNVFAVRLPPLRERHGDLAPLVRHFLARHDRGHEWTIESAALAALERHRWPGNVREAGNFCAALAVRAASPGRITLADVEAVWRRQHPHESPPWQGSAPEHARGRLGTWALEQARAARFNLIEAARLLARRKRAGQAVPITERSALSYYVVGEILNALADARGDTAAATTAIASDQELEARVAPRVAKVAAALRASGGDPARARRRFGKLPAGYEEALARALRAAGD